MVRVVIKVRVRVRETIMVNTTQNPNPTLLNQTVQTAAARNKRRQKNYAPRWRYRVGS